MLVRSLLSGLLILTVSGTAQPEKKKLDPQADAALRRMSEYLDGLKSFTLETQAADEFVTKEGQRIQFVSRSRVMVQRPNHLRSDRIGAVADLTFRYDGKEFSLYGNKTGYYATAPAPPTIEEAVDVARAKLGIEAPGADLLMKNVYDGLMEDVVSSTYVGLEPLNQINTHHLAFRGKEVDWQIWIADAPEARPMRYVIVSKKVIGQPEFSVEIVNWDTQAVIPDDSFAFKPPPGAQKIEFLDQTARAKTKKEKR